MSNAARRAFGIIWLLLGIGGIALVIQGANRAGTWLADHILITDAIFLVVSVAAIAGGLGLLKHWSKARMILRTVATILILYGVLFQVMVNLAFGWIWFFATIALILFSAASLWSLRHSPHHI